MKINSSKKANVGMTKLVIIIVAIIGFALVTAMIISTNKTVNSLEEEQICKYMLTFQDFTNTNTAVLNPKVKNQCETIHKTISKKIHSSYELYSELGLYLAQASWVIGHGNYPDLWGGHDFTENVECAILYDVEIPEIDSLKEQKDTLNFLNFKLFLESSHYKKIDDIPYTYMDYVIDHPDTQEPYKVVLAPWYYQTGRKVTLVEEDEDWLYDQQLTIPNHYAVAVLSVDASANWINWASKRTAAADDSGNVYLFNEDATIVWFTSVEEAIGFGCVYLNEQDSL